MTTNMDLVSQVLGVLTDAREQAETTKYEVEEKQSRLEDLHTNLEDSLNTAEVLIESLGELESVLETLEDSVTEYESEF